jgi:cell division protein FtsB
MTENSDLERLQQLVAQNRALEAKHAAAELECSRLHAEIDRLQAALKLLQGHKDQLFDIARDALMIGDGNE